MLKKKRKYEYYRKLLKAESKERYVLGLKEFWAMLIVIPLLIVVIIISSIFANQCFDEFGKYSMSGGFTLILVLFEVLMLFMCVLAYIDCHSDKYILNELSKLENEIDLIEKYIS